MVNPMASPIIALGKALCIWIGIYSVLVGVFMVVHWDRVNPVLTTTVAEQPLSTNASRVVAGTIGEEHPKESAPRTNGTTTTTATINNNRTQPTTSTTAKESSSREDSHRASSSSSSSNKKKTIHNTTTSSATATTTTSNSSSTLVWYHTEHHRKHMEQLDTFVQEMEREIRRTVTLQTKLKVLIERLNDHVTSPNEYSTQDITGDPPGNHDWSRDDHTPPPSAWELFATLKRTSRLNPTAEKENNDVNTNNKNKNHDEEQRYHDPSRFRDLYLQQDLQQAYPMEVALRQAFRVAINDLAKIIHRADETDWVAFHAVMEQIQQNTPDRSTTTTPPSCQDEQTHDTITNDDETGKTTGSDDDTKYLKQADLQEYVDHVRNELHRRLLPYHHTVPRMIDPTTGEEIFEEEEEEDARIKLSDPIPLYVVESLERLVEFRDELLVEIRTEREKIKAQKQKQLLAQREQEAEDNGVCIRSHQVLPWMEAGLDALYRQKDPREAILKAVLEDGNVPATDVSKIILDAILLPENQLNLPHDKPRNLRQLLNGPGVGLTAAFINTVVDLISGYYDPLDLFLDRLAVEWATQDLGNAVVTRLLEQAAKVPVPGDLLQVITSKSGMLT